MGNLVESKFVLRHLPIWSPLIYLDKPKALGKAACPACKYKLNCIHQLMYVCMLALLNVIKKQIN